MSVARAVAAQYRGDDLEGVILAALSGAGVDVEHLTTAALAGGDEFHFGRGAATAAFAESLGFARGAHLLDIGAGVGGPARHFAEARGCRVTGVDLSESFVRVAASLTRRCRLGDRASFLRGSALALPFADAVFDGACLIHVGMNIADKTRAFAEARRALKPGGRFGVYDVMRVGAGDLDFPMPWAATAHESFVVGPADYRSALANAGFAIESETDRTGLALRVGRELRERVAREGPPPFTVNMLMGPTAPQRWANVSRALDAGVVAPVEIVVRAL